MKFSCHLCITYKHSWAVGTRLFINPGNEDSSLSNAVHGYNLCLRLAFSWRIRNFSRPETSCQWNILKTFFLDEKRTCIQLRNMYTLLCTVYAQWTRWVNTIHAYTYSTRVAHMRNVRSVWDIDGGMYFSWRRLEHANRNVEKNPWSPHGSPWTIFLT